eukprot:CAMPEP_0194091050 /NCGR_PEP_ID=MMETSP0149-20130528/41390_1 /TAXON_ID=122233 /ORGANISM="Chaetoceros debilis, Strain MM31A-1" /LENGTH=73 /DNA_ID=CAMNT_0038775507 /DNA_START=78 /DNA_END=296 /DNA_ORIENTATION=-
MVRCSDSFASPILELALALTLIPEDDGPLVDRLLAAVRDMYALMAESMVGRSLKSDCARASAGFIPDDMTEAA